MNKRAQILEINKRKDLSRKQKTELIQKLFTPELPQEEEEDNVKEKADGWDNLFENLCSICHADQSDLDKAEFAAAACHVTLLPSSVEEDDFCAFTRENLQTYKHVGSIVVSVNNPNSRGKLEWIQLCNGKEKGNLDNVHFFNVDFLSQWIKEKGPLYIECPMCRRGTNKKRVLQEQEIESMEQLKTERENFLQAHDYAMVTFKDQQIVEKACSEYWDIANNAMRRTANEDALAMVLANWMQHRQFHEYKGWFYVQAKECIKSGNAQILGMVLGHYQERGETPSDQFNECLQICCEQNNPECLDVCLTYGAEESQFCSALLACAKNKNEDMFKRVAMRMTTQNVSEDHFFISPDLYKTILMWDSVEAMRTIFNNRWKTRLEPQEIELLSTMDATQIYQYFDESGRLEDDDAMDFADQVEEEVFGMDAPPVITRDTSWGDDAPVDDDEDSW